MAIELLLNAITQLKNRFKNREGLVVLKHLSMMKTLLSVDADNKNANGKDSKTIEKASLEV
jgi:hypothetical protein